MFSESERDLLKISRAIINLHGFFVVDKELNIIDNPIIIVDLLTKVELESFKALSALNPMEKYNVENSIAENCILAVVGSDVKIAFDYSPAGIVSFIANAVVVESEKYLNNENNNAWFETVNSVNYLETMCSIIAYYMNISYDYAISLPISEIYKRYAVCHKAFPSQIQAINI